MEFEWDEAKAASNVRKHGVAFEDATAVFDDELRFEYSDSRGEYDEERWITIGLVDLEELTVVTTSRVKATRLISARKATPNERREYWQHRSLSI